MPAWCRGLKIWGPTGWSAGWSWTTGLYAAGQSEITLEDAQAVIGDAAAVTLTMWFSQQPGET